MAENANLMEKVTSLAKRRGFVYPAADIYGGTGAVWDFGPMGALLKTNLRNFWIKKFVQERDDTFLIESSLLTKKDVLVASGHVSDFNDPMVECLSCNMRFREDHPETIEEHTKETGHKDFSDSKKFNLMFSTFLGPIENEENKAYLRPETAQGMFVNFNNVLATNRVKLPFGIAQVGKSFRNEITTKTFIFRTREFEIAEIEYFVTPGEDEEWFSRWIDLWEGFFIELGIRKEKLRRFSHPKEKLAHYSKGTVDIEYEFPFGFSEVAGIANRTDFDLSQHEKHSKQELAYFDQEKNTKFKPYTIEPTLGVERTMLAILVDAYTEEDSRTYLKIKPVLAPYKVAVFPLLANKPELISLAKSIYADLKKDFFTAWDDRGNIGKRYAAQDEIGTPWCVTVDFQSLEDNAVTVRDRDTATQERIQISNLGDYFIDKIAV